MRLTELVTPLKPLEAMAQGRLFVASDVGGHKELIRNGETGWLFQAGSAEALADADRRPAGAPRPVAALRAAGPASSSRASATGRTRRRAVPGGVRAAGGRGALTVAVGPGDRRPQQPVSQRRAARRRALRPRAHVPRRPRAAAGGRRADAVVPAAGAAAPLQARLSARRAAA
ncbi:MAG: glycosyltransferase [Comamonadaceae bacterium]|nr:glycosyltransferase [Comamonadaceae bacterium]